VTTRYWRFEPVNDVIAVSRFRKSSWCNGADGCVEVASTDDGFLVRDSKLDDSPILRFGPQAWTEFVASVRDGQFD
jgi:Domain of unknown function (DUF397)